MRPLPESEAGQRPYEITDAGRADLALWFATRSAVPTGPATSWRSSWRWP
ncbi:hypothetical protein NKG94_25190 [Micromonospora sp. M12]